MLAKNWQSTGNVKSAEKLVTSHLRLVAKIAMGYKGYGLPLNEMISEGNVGLMQAVKNLSPKKVLDLQLMQCGGSKLQYKNIY
jgi:RNA polymerase sigma-32 factor